MSEQNATGATPPADTAPQLKFKVPENLSGSDFGAAREALLEAFPTQEQLKSMLQVQLNTRLDRIVGPSNLGHQVFNLLGWAERGGRVNDLMQGAYRENPNCPELNAFLTRFAVK